MVKIPDAFEQAGRAVRERWSERTTHRNHHNWGARLGRRRDEPFTGPKGLLELEALARRSATLMEKYSPNSKHNYDRAMELLRQQYNMNYIVVCEKCGGPHVNNELIAPER